MTAAAIAPWFGPLAEADVEEALPTIVTGPVSELAGNDVPLYLAVKTGPAGKVLCQLRSPDLTMMNWRFTLGVLPHHEGCNESEYEPAANGTFCQPWICEEELPAAKRNTSAEVVLRHEGSHESVNGWVAFRTWPTVGDL